MPSVRRLRPPGHVLCAGLCSGGLAAAVAWTSLMVAARLGTNLGWVAVVLLVGGWVVAGCVARQIACGTTTSWVVAIAAGSHVAIAEHFVGVPASGLVGQPVVVAGICVAAGHSALDLWADARRRRWAAAFVGTFSLVVVVANPSGAWISGARLKSPTATQVASSGVDVVVDTHQWLAERGIAVLAGDGYATLIGFLDSVDPSAPGTTPAVGEIAGPFTYRWRLLRGARDADGTLYPMMRDHFHNLWTHRGRQWTVGGSAASHAESAVTQAVGLWQSGQRGEAIYWLGAAVHLLDDTCVPQHQFFAINPYHHQYELWVSRFQDRLAVDSGGIYQADFRVGGGHGGASWSSSHPRGWVDECAHRAGRNLQAASNPNGPGDALATDPRWRSAPHVADVQRLTAGFIRFFFNTVGGP